MYKYHFISFAVVILSFQSIYGQLPNTLIVGDETGQYWVQDGTIERIDGSFEIDSRARQNIFAKLELEKKYRENVTFEFEVEAMLGVKNINLVISNVAQQSINQIIFICKKNYVWIEGANFVEDRNKDVVEGIDFTSPLKVLINFNFGEQRLKMTINDKAEFEYDTDVPLDHINLIGYATYRSRMRFKPVKVYGE